MASPCFSPPPRTLTLYASLDLLSRLPPVLFAAVLQHLPLTEKIASLTHISRRFPALTPPCFRHDALTLDRLTFAAWRSSPALRYLLSEVTAVLLNDADWKVRGSRSRVVKSLLPPRTPSQSFAFPAAGTLVLDGLCPDFGEAELTALLATGCFPQLHTLRLTAVMEGNSRLCSAQALQSLVSYIPGLRTLILQPHLQPLDRTAFRLLCALPLTQLELSGCYMDSSDHLEHEKDLPPPTTTWTTVRLTRQLQAGDVAETLQHYLTTPSGLTSLHLQGCSALFPTVQGLGLSALALSLVSLSLADCNDSSAVPFALLSADQSRPLLHRLRHLRVTAPQTSVRFGPEEQARVAQLWCRVLLAYRPLLRCLNLRLSLETAHAPIVHGALSCAQMRKCHLSLLEHSVHSVQPAEVARALLRALDRLPQLHTLKIAGVLSADELAVFLAACTELQTLKLLLVNPPTWASPSPVPSSTANHTPFPSHSTLDDRQTGPVTILQLLPLLSRHCHQLRSLELMHVSGLSAADEAAAEEAVPIAPTDSHSRPFGELRSLTMFLRQPSWTAACMRYVVSKFCHAPLRQLQIPQAPLELLHWLSPLSHLRILQAAMPFRRLNPPPYARFFQLYNPHAGDRQCVGREELQRQLLGGREPIENESAMSDEQLEANTRLQFMRHFVRERLFDGRDGREAFMHMMSQESEKKSQKAAAMMV